MTPRERFTGGAAGTGGEGGTGWAEQAGETGGKGSGEQTRHRPPQYTTALSPAALISNFVIDAFTGMQPPQQPRRNNPPRNISRIPNA